MRKPLRKVEIGSTFRNDFNRLSSPCVVRQVWIAQCDSALSLLTVRQVFIIAAEQV